MKNIKSKLLFNYFCISFFIMKSEIKVFAQPRVEMSGFVQGGANKAYFCM